VQLILREISILRWVYSRDKELVSTDKGVPGGMYTTAQKLSFLGYTSTRCDANLFATIEIDG
jgi:hypothetical protein